MFSEAPAGVNQGGSVAVHKIPTPLAAVDLFCGAGGLSMGFHRAGFQLKAAVEYDRHAAATYATSFVSTYSPKTQLLNCDIRDRAVSKALREICHTRKIDIVIGGPPCQDFSRARLRTPQEVGRASLVDQYFTILKIVKPRAFVFENVPNLIAAAGGRYWENVRDHAARLGYQLHHQVLRAEDYGVPQRRHRLFVVGLKKSLGNFEFPTPTMRPPPSVREVIGHLVRLKAGECAADDPMHRARRHLPKIVEYLKLIKQGQSWRDVQNHRILPCHVGHPGHHDVYGRIRARDVAPTITGGCTNPSKGRFIHPTQHRGLTIREAALLQTFPADWQFQGGIESASLQVGNAVPVLLGEALAIQIREALSRRPRHL